MTYRVVQWTTGNVGRHSIAGIDARPDLELVGLWVSSADKVGKDAGSLAGLGRTLGVEATNDAAALYALRPDCVVYNAMADVRLKEAVDDLCGLLRAGINVVSSWPGLPPVPRRHGARLGRRLDRRGGQRRRRFAVR